MPAGRGDAGERSHMRGAQKKGGATPAHREVVRALAARGLSERHALRIVGMRSQCLSLSARSRT